MYLPIGSPPSRWVFYQKVWVCINLYLFTWSAAVMLMDSRRYFLPVWVRWVCWVYPPASTYVTRDRIGFLPTLSEPSKVCNAILEQFVLTVVCQPWTCGTRYLMPGRFTTAVYFIFSRRWSNGPRRWGNPKIVYSLRNLGMSVPGFGGPPLTVWTRPI